MEGILLLGWIKRELAISVLRERCLFSPPLSEDHAEHLWARHRRQVEHLPDRPSRPAKCWTMTTEEEVGVADFLEEMARVGSKVRSVVKIDARPLAVRQLGLTLDRAEHFRRLCHSRAEWIGQWLNPPPTAIGGRVTSTINSVNVEVPHPEFVLGFDSTRGFQVVETPRFITVALEPNGPALTAGHHRAFGYLSSDLARSDPSILAVQYSSSNGETPPPAPVVEGAPDLCARCPPLMSDFFDPRFAYRVQIRPRRYELQVRARMAVVSL